MKFEKHSKENVIILRVKNISFKYFIAIKKLVF